MPAPKTREAKKRLAQREKIKQLKRKLNRLEVEYAFGAVTREKQQQQDYLFACLSSKLWSYGMTYKQIAGIYNTSQHRIRALIYRHFPNLSDPVIQAEQKLRTKQNWFECYDLLVNYGVSYNELELYLNSCTNLLVNQNEINKEILAIKKLLEKGAKWNSKTGYYTFLAI